MFLDRLFELANRLCQQVHECQELQGGLLTAECHRTSRELAMELRRIERAREIENKKEDL